MAIIKLYLKDLMIYLSLIFHPFTKSNYLRTPRRKSINTIRGYRKKERSRHRQGILMSRLSDRCCGILYIPICYIYTSGYQWSENCIFERLHKHLTHVHNIEKSVLMLYNIFLSISEQL